MFVHTTFSLLIDITPYLKADVLSLLVTVQPKHKIAAAGSLHQSITDRQTTEEAVATV